VSTNTHDERRDAVEPRAERKARLHRERQAAYRDRKREEKAAREASNAAALTRDEAEREEPVPSPPVKTEPRSGGGSADGRVLAVIGIPTPGGFAAGVGAEIFYSRSAGHLSTPSYKAWLDMPREALGADAFATLVLPSARLTFDPLDVHDVARVATLAEEELGLDINDLRSTLASVRAGATFTLDG
jgi:hypothetical protein